MPDSVSSDTRGGSTDNHRLELLIMLVPRFEPANVHLFFTSFERAVVVN